MSLCLTDLLSRYPVLASDVLTDDEPPIAEIEPQELSPTKVVNLDDWFVPVAEVEPIAEAESSPSEEAQRIERAEATLYFTGLLLCPFGTTWPRH